MSNIWYEDISQCFESNIGVKQRCPLSPTLFGLYIDKLEDWINNTKGEGIHLARYVLKLLFYVDDLILIAKLPLGFERTLEFSRTPLSRGGNASKC